MRENCTSSSERDKPRKGLTYLPTTLLCQKEFLPTFIKWLATYIGLKLANGWVYVIEFLLAVGFFTLTSFLAFKVINWADNNKDEKKDESSRMHTAEYFHKVILNNVIMGASFVKKVQSKMDELESQNEQLKNKDELEIKFIENSIYDLKHECCLYIAQALFYLELANRELNEKQIIEAGTRKEYVEYLNDVGIVTLIETLKMFEQSLNDLKDLIKLLVSSDCCRWKPNSHERKMLNLCIPEIEDLKRDILILETNLNDTIKVMQR